MFRLTLAGSAAGGLTVVTGQNCYGEVAAQVDASFVRHGPKGTAARISADLSGEVELAATFTVSGNCRAASSINFTGGPEPGATRPALPRRRKTVAFRKEGVDAYDMQKRANPARTGRRKRFARLIIGLTLAGSAAGGLTVVTGQNCYGEVAAQVDASFVRHGPKGTAARISAPSDGSGAPTGPARRAISAASKGTQASELRASLACNSSERSLLEV